MSVHKIIVRSLGLFLILNLTLPSPTFALRPGAGLEEPTSPIRIDLAKRLSALPAPASIHRSAGLEETLKGLTFEQAKEELQRRKLWSVAYWEVDPNGRRQLMDFNYKNGRLWSTPLETFEKLAQKHQTDTAVSILFDLSFQSSVPPEYHRQISELLPIPKNPTHAEVVAHVSALSPLQRFDPKDIVEPPLDTGLEETLAGYLQFIEGIDIFKLAAQAEAAIGDPKNEAALRQILPNPAAVDQAKKNIASARSFSYSKLAARQPLVDFLAAVWSAKHAGLEETPSADRPASSAVAGAEKLHGIDQVVQALFGSQSRFRLAAPGNSQDRPGRSERIGPYAFSVYSRRILGPGSGSHLAVVLLLKGLANVFSPEEIHKAEEYQFRFLRGDQATDWQEMFSESREHAHVLMASHIFSEIKDEIVVEYRKKPSTAGLEELESTFGLSPKRLKERVRQVAGLVHSYEGVAQSTLLGSLPVGKLTEVKKRLKAKNPDLREVAKALLDAYMRLAATTSVRITYQRVEDPNRLSATMQPSFEAGRNLLLAVLNATLQTLIAGPDSFSRHESPVSPATGLEEKGDKNVSGWDQVRFEMWDVVTQTNNLIRDGKYQDALDRINALRRRIGDFSERETYLMQFRENQILFLQALDAQDPNLLDQAIVRMEKLRGSPAIDPEMHPEVLSYRVGFYKQISALLKARGVISGSREDLQAASYDINRALRELRSLQLQNPGQDYSGVVERLERDEQEIWELLRESPDPRQLTAGLEEMAVVGTERIDWSRMLDLTEQARQVGSVLERFYGSSERFLQASRGIRRAAQAGQPPVAIFLPDQNVPGGKEWEKVSILAEVEGGFRQASGWREELPFTVELASSDVRRKQLLAGGYRVIQVILPQEQDLGVLTKEGLFMLVKDVYQSAIQQPFISGRPTPIFVENARPYHQVQSLSYADFVAGAEELWKSM